MKSRIYANGGWVYLDNETVKGWHHCKDSEFFANQSEYKGELDDKLIKWVGAPIPKDLFAKCLALIKAFPTTEVMICLSYNPKKKQWFASVPKQSGSGASVRYDGDDEKEPKGFYFMGTIHSHPNMSAFWSGTDIEDQTRLTGLHIVVGTSMGTMTSHRISFFLHGKRYDQTDDVIEMPDLDALPDVDPEWKAKVDAPLPYQAPEIKPIKIDPLDIGCNTGFDVEALYSSDSRFSDYDLAMAHLYEGQSKADMLKDVLWLLKEMGEDDVAYMVASQVAPETEENPFND